MRTFIIIFCASLAIAIGCIGIMATPDVKMVDVTTEQLGVAIISFAFLIWGFLALIFFMTEKK